MKLLSLDTPEILELVSSWLIQKENYQYLDFGNGRRIVTPALLKIMAQRETHFLRAYTSDRDDTPIGVLGLNSVDRIFRTATFWGVSGEKSFRNRGRSTFASSKFLTLAFRDLDLHAINTWAVDRNPSLRTIERLGFRFIGRQRQCHYIDGQLHDRLLFDLLASEHRKLDEERWRRSESSHREAVCEERLVEPG
ncbi:MAG: GNAT family N-acetyltransferase [Betaproteobacteria bacterium]|nr:MAG: GNAT family N-acetyltransferase [Betaproteobacteria bacterium]